MRRPISILLAALPLLLGAGGTALRPHNVLLSRFRTEPVVAIDAADPSIIVAGANTNYIAQPDGTFPVPFFTSHDGGSSFSVGTLPMPAPYVTGADTSVAIAGDGTIFYSYLAESPTYCSSGPGAILLAHSVDHGVSFRGPVVVDSNPADDRPTLAVERSEPGRPSHLFVAWTRSYPDHSEIWFARSVDGGATFDPAVRLYSSPLDNFGAQPVVGPGGYVYVSWLSHNDGAPGAAGPAQVLLTASDDDGASFGPIHGAGPAFATLPMLGQPGALRDLTTVAVAVAPSGAVGPRSALPDGRGPATPVTGGALYVAYAAVRAPTGHPSVDGSVNADIWLRRSLDHGATWSVPERVNDARRGDRFMPALSALPDGTLGVVFYDRRAGPGELDVYAARASFAHGFKVTPNMRVNSAPSPVSNIVNIKKGNSCFPSGRFFGDYIGAAAGSSIPASVGSSMLSVVWAGTQPRQKSETDLWFAQVPLPAFVQVRVPPRQSSSAFSWVGGIVHSLPGRIPGGQMPLVYAIFLLPALSAGFVVLSWRRSSRW